MEKGRLEEKRRVLSKVERAVNDIKNQIKYMVFESKNKDLSISKDSSEKLISDGWVRNRVNILFAENTFSEEELNRYYKDCCQDINILSLEVLDYAFPDKGFISVKEFMYSMLFTIVDRCINLEISNYLKEIKSVNT